jgi:hypothetical protein
VTRRVTSDLKSSGPDDQCSRVRPRFYDSCDSKLMRERLDRPRRAAALEEVAVPGQNGRVEDDRQRDGWPVSRIARDSPQRGRLQGGVRLSWDNLERTAVDQAAHRPSQNVTLSGSQDPFTARISNRRDSSCSGLVIFGDDDAESRMREERPPTTAQELSDEDAGVRDDDHSGSGRRKSNFSDNSSSVIPVSASTRSTASPSRATARRASSSSRSSGM